MSLAGYTWANTFGPLVALMLAAIVLPALTVPRATRSQARLAAGIGLAAAGLMGLAMAVFVPLQEGVGAGRLIRQAAMSALAWAPMLALVWLIRAQGVERRRSEDLMKEDR